MKYSLVVLALLGLISSANAHKIRMTSNAVQSTSQKTKENVKIATKSLAREEDDAAITLAMDQNLLEIHDQESESEDEQLSSDNGESSDELSGESSDEDKEDTTTIEVVADVQLGEGDVVPDENMVMDPPESLVNMQMGAESESSDSEDSDADLQLDQGEEEVEGMASTPGPDMMMMGLTDDMPDQMDEYLEDNEEVNVGPADSKMVSTDGEADVLNQQYLMAEADLQLAESNGADLDAPQELSEMEKQGEADIEKERKEEEEMFKAEKAQ